MFELIWRSIGALVAVMGFGIVLKVPRRFLLWAGIDGAVGWFIYLTVEQTTGSMLASTFLGAVGIAVGAHICADDCARSGNVSNCVLYSAIGA